jgi:hypothetical protein
MVLPNATALIDKIRFDLPRHHAVEYRTQLNQVE